MCEKNFDGKVMSLLPPDEDDINEETIVDDEINDDSLIIDDEDNINNGFGAEIAARISEHCFEYLDAPVKRVASKDIPIAYSSILEKKILVQTEWICAAIKELLGY